MERAADPVGTSHGNRSRAHDAYEHTTDSQAADLSRRCRGLHTVGLDQLVRRRNKRWHDRT